MLSAKSAINLGEGLKNRSESVSLDANSGIGHPYRHAAFQIYSAGNLNASAGPRKLDGIAQDIEEHLLGLALVGAEHWQAGGHAEFDAKSSLFDARPQ